MILIIIPWSFINNLIRVFNFQNSLTMSHVVQSLAFVLSLHSIFSSLVITVSIPWVYIYDIVSLFSNIFIIFVAIILGHFVFFWLLWLEVYVGRILGGTCCLLICIRRNVLLLIFCSYSPIISYFFTCLDNFCTFF